MTVTLLYFNDALEIYQNNKLLLTIFDRNFYELAILKFTSDLDAQQINTEFYDLDYLVCR